jgi:hypothetical protein
VGYPLPLPPQQVTYPAWAHSLSFTRPSVFSHPREALGDCLPRARVVIDREEETKEQEKEDATATRVSGPWLVTRRRSCARIGRSCWRR